jgi:hypothetical protein
LAPLLLRPLALLRRPLRWWLPPPPRTGPRPLPAPIPPPGPEPLLPPPLRPPLELPPPKPLPGRVPAPRLWRDCSAQPQLRPMSRASPWGTPTGTAQRISPPALGIDSAGPRADSTPRRTDPAGVRPRSSPESCQTSGRLRRTPPRLP